MKNLAFHNIFMFTSFFIVFSLLPIKDVNAQQYAGSEWFKHIIAGDARKLSAWLEPFVALELPTGSAKYSRQQATAVLVGFFQDNAPTRIEIEKTGTTGNSTDFYIGTYHTNTTEFRLYLLITKTGGDEKIHSLSITRK